MHEIPGAPSLQQRHSHVVDTAVENHGPGHEIRRQREGKPGGILLIGAHAGVHGRHVGAGGVSHEKDVPQIQSELLPVFQGEPYRVVHVLETGGEPVSGR